jgi:uncharacterized protein
MTGGINDPRISDTTLPVWRSASAPFWQATREKKLILQYSKESGKFQFYPRPLSIYSGTRDLEWRESSGLGEIFSFTVVRRSRGPLRGSEPFFIALVTLDEGVNVMANVVNCSKDDMKIGLRVRPHWHPLSNGMHLLMFEPAQGAGVGAVPG